jgi:transformation/transcription domain-associated protein
MLFLKKQAATARAHAASAATPQAMVDHSKRSDLDRPMRDGTGDLDMMKKEAFVPETIGQSLASLPPQPSFVNAPHSSDSLGAEVLQRPAPAQGSADNTQGYPIRQPWEYIEEIVQILKTASPLLILSMETMVEQIHHKFKATQEEEIYRLTNMLLNDAIQVNTIDQVWFPTFKSWSELSRAYQYSRRRWATRPTYYQ